MRVVGVKKVCTTGVSHHDNVQCEVLDNKNNCRAESTAWRPFR